MSRVLSVSIVIITRDTKELLRDLLRSVEGDKALKPRIRETIVVDNGSSDGTAEMVKGDFPQCLIMEPGKNLGFAAAVNLGWLSSSADVVLFLNSDTRLLEGEIGKLLDYMEAHPGVGICGPRLVYEDMRLQRSFAASPSLLPEVCPAGLLELLFPRKYPGKGTGISHPLEVDSLIGAAIAVRRDLLLLLDGFDERFFFFMEETDLCIRTRRQGYGVIFFPEARVIHLQGKTVRKNWVRGRMEYNISLYKFIRKHHGPFYSGLFRAIRLFKATLFLVVATVIPLLLVGRRIRMSYGYYLNLFRWHLKGCPDSGGLRIPEN